MPIDLDTEAHRSLLQSIRRFFDQELDQEIGELKARRVLEFVLEEIGPSIYNQAVADVQTYLQDKLADMGAVYYKPEFDFWKKR